MSSSPYPTDGPTTEREFHDGLGTLLRQAHKNGVDVEGGWEYRHMEPELPDWGVEIYVVTKDS